MTAMLVVVTEEPLDEALARSHVTKDKNGAVLVFLGVVRDHHEGREVTGVEYHAFRPMAEKELLTIAQASAAKAGVEDVAVLHRVGRLAVGDVSLIVAVGSPHREQAFVCARDLIEALKARVPIWKKELGPAGSTWQEGVVAPGEDR
jgi:molybdopterin synthase catalytic subunit